MQESTRIGRRHVAPKSGCIMYHAIFKSHHNVQEKPASVSQQMTKQNNSIPRGKIGWQSWGCWGDNILRRL